MSDSIYAMFGGDYLSADDIGDKTPTLTIDRASRAELVSDEGRDAKVRPVIGFAGKRKLMVLNKTNAFALAAMFGDDWTKQWIGKRITIGTSLITNGSYKGKRALRVLGSPDIDRDIEYEFKLNPRTKSCAVSQ